jgi:histidine triad (HIT) family protein|tara:strand:- start:104 stop:454 length:351 start_codon:yes stop_codon:yes gene_type:complete
MDYDDDNIFAKILNNKLLTDIILENEHAIAFHDIAPQAPVHILIIPKGKFIKYDDFLNKASKDEIYYFFDLINQLVKVYDLENTGYRLISNAGKNANQEVPHLHFHLLAGKNLGKM